MSLIKELIALAQELDGLGLTKEADILDNVSAALSKIAHDDEISMDNLDFKMFEEIFQHHIMQGFDVSESMQKAIDGIKELEKEQEEWEVPTSDERAKARQLMTEHQLPSFFEDQDLTETDN